MSAQTSQREPLSLLSEIERRSKEVARGLPSQDELRVPWKGIGFRLGESHALAPLAEVVEILTQPQLTRVPGTLSWVRGVANVRGKLLPIMDLLGFLGVGPTRLTKQSRVIVTDHAGVYVGLLVDEVVGLKHLHDDERLPHAPLMGDVITPFLQAAYVQAGQTWVVFSMHALAEHPGFLQVAQ